MKYKALAKISAVVITIVLVAILLSQISISDVAKMLASIDPVYLIIGFVLYLFSYFFRALRFQILLGNKIGFKDLFSIVCVHNMANNILPARTGELSYIYLLKKDHNKKVGEGIATLFVARVFDFISISLLFFISALMIQDLPAIITKVVWVIAFFMVLSVIFLIALLYFRGSFLNSVRKFFGRFNLDKKYFGDYLLRKGEETVESFGVIFSHKRNSSIFCFSVLIWCFMFLKSYVLLIGIGVHLTIFSVITGLTLVRISTDILPIRGIGGFGTDQCIWVIAFMPLGLSKEIAIVSAFSLYIITYAYFLILGVYGLSVVKRSDKKVWIG